MSPTMQQLIAYERQFQGQACQLVLTRFVIESLRPRQRQILETLAQRDHTSGEIADLLGISIGHASTELGRLRDMGIMWHYGKITQGGVTWKLEERYEKALSTIPGREAGSGRPPAEA